MGIEIEIVPVTDLIEKHNAIGRSKYPEQQILIDVSATPIDSIMQAYYHEKTHWILYLMGEKELQLNEKFVDLFAHILYQSDKSAE